MYFDLTGRRASSNRYSPTSHAGLVGEYLFEELAHLPVEVEYAL